MIATDKVQKHAGQTRQFRLRLDWHTLECGHALCMHAPRPTARPSIWIGTPLTHQLLGHEEGAQAGDREGQCTSTEGSRGAALPRKPVAQQAHRYAGGHSFGDRHMGGYKENLCI